MFLMASSTPYPPICSCSDTPRLSQLSGVTSEPAPRQPSSRTGLYAYCRGRWPADTSQALQQGEPWQELRTRTRSACLSQVDRDASKLRTQRHNSPELEVSRELGPPHHIILQEAASSSRARLPDALMTCADSALVSADSSLIRADKMHLQRTVSINLSRISQQQQSNVFSLLPCLHNFPTSNDAPSRDAGKWTASAKSVFMEDNLVLSNCAGSELICHPKV